MTNNPQASIIVPLLLQQDAWLKQCLLSALTQTTLTQVLVVTSPDTPTSNLRVLRHLAADHSNLKWFERQPGHGFAAAINEGWQQAQTERVGLLLSDDWLSAHTIEQCLIEDADIVSTGHIGYRADGREVLWRRKLNQKAFEALKTLESKASYLTHFFLFRRSVVLAVGGVDTHIGHVGPDDYDLPWTLLEQGASVALTAEPLYHYRDHNDTRLTLRPQQEQVRDLRRLLTKHGVEIEEQDRLVAEKSRWYGVPCHVAMENPDWFRFQPGDINLSDDLQSLVDDVGIPLIGAQRVSLKRVADIGRSSFRLVFADGSVRKGRTVATRTVARTLFELAPVIADLPLAPVLARRGRALLEQWVDGMPLDSNVLGMDESETGLAEQAGEIMGGLAVLSAEQSGIDSRPRHAKSKLDKLEMCLAALMQASLLEEIIVDQLLQLARGNAPDLVATGLVHLDICPANLVLTSEGLRLIDNESLSVGALAQDLARTWYLWPMNEQSQMAFLKGYGRYRSPMDFVRHEVFWAIVTLASGAEYRLGMNLEVAQSITALKRIAAGDLPKAWLSAAPDRSEFSEVIRVGFLCDYLAVGGQERALLNMLTSFDTTRFRCFVYAFRGGEMAEQIISLGIPLMVGSPKPPLNWKQSWTREDAEEKLAYRRQLAEALRRDNIDVVINFAWPDGVGAARDAGVKVMVERLDGPGLLEKIIDKSSFDYIVCQSATIHDHMLLRARKFGLEDKQVKLIYPGLDLDRFNPQRYDRNTERLRLGFNDNELVIGYIGRLDLKKNINVLIHALARIDEQTEGVNVKLMIMGPDAGALSQLHKVCTKLVLGERVQFVEPEEDVAPTLAALDIFATPTMGEGIPNAVLEAMAMGLPIVASDVGSIHEVIEGNGFLVTDPDPVRFARPLRRLIRSARLRKRCSVNSRRVAQRFSLDYAIKAYESLIIECLSNDKPS